MSKIKLSKLETGAPKKADKEKYKEKTAQLAEEIGVMAEMLYASKSTAFWWCFKAWTPAAKMGVVKSVFANCPALSIDAHAFKKPTEEEMSHDFLWRVHQYAPAKGLIKLFIRSHYEDVLIQRVHKWIDDQKAAMRMEAINHFEKSLIEDNGTTLLKFYLHLSHERQLEKLEERRVEPEKQWKYNPADFEESKLWDQYMKCYEDAINGSQYPWHIIPSDQRWYRNHCVAEIVHSTLKKLKLSYPTLSNA